MIKKFKILIGYILLLPLWVVIKYHKSNGIVIQDIHVWLKNYHQPTIISYKNFVWLFILFKPFRNVIYYRLKGLSYLSRWIYKQQQEPIISCIESIGKGLFFCHGFATIIAAKSIGENCWINQQVTIGDSSTGVPAIGNNVMIYAGAIVLGNITIGDNSIIGAGAVVVKSVPENCVVVGNPARIIKRNGVKVDEKL